MALAWIIASGGTILIIAAIIAPIALIIVYWDEIKEFTIKAWGVIWEFLKGLWDDIVAMVGDAIAMIKYILFNFVPLVLISQHWDKITGWIDRSEEQLEGKE